MDRTRISEPHARAHRTPHHGWPRRPPKNEPRRRDMNHFTPSTRASLAVLFLIGGAGCADPVEIKALGVGEAPGALEVSESNGQLVVAAPPGRYNDFGIYVNVADESCS